MEHRRRAPAYFSSFFNSVSRHVDLETLAFLQILKYAKLSPTQGLWTRYSLCLHYSFPYFLMAGPSSLSMTSSGRPFLISNLSTAPCCFSQRTITICNYKFAYMLNSIFTTIQNKLHERRNCLLYSSMHT